MSVVNKLRVKTSPVFSNYLRASTNFAEDNELWRIADFFNAGIPVLVPKLSAQIKEKNTENISYLIKYSRQLYLHLYLF